MSSINMSMAVSGSKIPSRVTPRPLVLVDESIEDIAPADPHPSGSLGSGFGIGRKKVNAPARPGPVVVIGVRGEDAQQVAPAEDQHVVEALSSNGADRALRERVRPRRTDGRLHDLESFRPQDLVKRS
jgi:hypothetical protein